MIVVNQRSTGNICDELIYYEHTDMRITNEQFSKIQNQK